MDKKSKSKEKRREGRKILKMKNEKNTISTVYIHIPFCKSKCFYCDFSSFAGQDDKIEKYFDALIKEIELVYKFYLINNPNGFEPLKSVFFGGGTPSYVPSKYITYVLTTLKNSFGLFSDAEITIECNPGTVDQLKMNEYKQNGINRISIGLQTSSDSLLNKIGRIHTLEQFEQCINYADKAGIINRNADIMFGLPGQTIDDVKDTINLVLRKKMTHVSFYSLILEEGTPFFDRYSDCSELLPSEDAEREMYWSGIEILEENGFLHYEISNLAKVGAYCKQNIAYWECMEYFGFGAGAHSYQNSERIENESDINNYIFKMINSPELSNAPAGINRSILSIEDKELEFFMLGFRLLKGIEIRHFEEIFGKCFDKYRNRLENLVKSGLVLYNNGNYKLSKKGVNFANQVFVEFI